MNDNLFGNFLSRAAFVLAQYVGPRLPTTRETLLSIVMRVPDHGNDLVAVCRCSKMTGKSWATLRAERRHKSRALYRLRRRASSFYAPRWCSFACPRAQNPRSEQLYSWCRMHDVDHCRACRRLCRPMLTGAAAYNGDVLERLGGGAEDEIAGHLGFAPKNLPNGTTRLRILSVSACRKRFDMTESK